MRTVGQGQAAVPRERVRRRRVSLLPEGGTLGRGRRSPGLSQMKVERYPKVPSGTFGFATGA